MRGWRWIVSYFWLSNSLVLTTRVSQIYSIISLLQNQLVYKGVDEKKLGLWAVSGMLFSCPPPIRFHIYSSSLLCLLFWFLQFVSTAKYVVLFFISLGMSLVALLTQISFALIDLTQHRPCVIAPNLKRRRVQAPHSISREHICIYLYMNMCLLYIYIYM